ncbi:hypothetical protein [Aliiroseovarius marinus]|uniref:hypothetical protein n=1 Tax=Aliiroseovarius marinus TaxID=2500159 RepID=UPI003D7E7B3F
MCTPRPSPLQNRVLPTGEVVADPARGMFTGNRGNLPFTDGRLGTSRWRHQHWIICDLKHPKGRYHGPMPARAWTPLFFLDEAVGLAAGHRPCAYCRPDAYADFKTAWAKAHGAMGHKDMDHQLHRARVTRSRQHIRHSAQADDLPDGCFILHDSTPCLLVGDKSLPYAPTGYGTPLPRPTGKVTVLTPAPTVATLRAGFRPVLAQSA